MSRKSCAVGMSNATAWWFRVGIGCLVIAKHFFHNPEFERFAISGLQTMKYFYWIRVRVRVRLSASQSGSIHTAPKIFETQLYFHDRVGLPSTLIHREVGAFRKRFSNWRNLHFHVVGKHFENQAFWRPCNRDENAIPCLPLETHSVIIAFWNFSGIV